MKTAFGWIARVRVLVLLGILLSIASFVIFQALGYTILYPDAQAHLLIARRVCDSTSPGLAQLGAVWLPLTHVASLPLVCLDTVLPFVGMNTLYLSGFGQSVLSMMSYVLMGVAVFLLVRDLFKSSSAGLVAWMVVMFNPNILYLQATPMTEVPLYCGIAWALYSFAHLLQNSSTLKWIAFNSAVCFLMSLIRYEAWFLIMLEVVVYTIVLLMRRAKFKELLGHLTIWGWVGLFGILGWLAWNQTIFHNFLEFQTGTYSKPSNWVAGTEAALGNLDKAFLTYWWGMWNTVGPIVIVGLIGAVATMIFVVRHLIQSERTKNFDQRERIKSRANHLRFIAPFLPYALIPFFVLSLYKGQRPMQVMEVEGSLYNARFALVMILPTAYAIGFLATRRLKTTILLVFVSLALMIPTQGIVTLEEPIIANRQVINDRQDEVVEWIHENYDGGLIMLESYGNERIQFFAHLPLNTYVYEGSYRLWGPALITPSENNIQWVIMRGGGDASLPSMGDDLVWRTLHDETSFQASYVLVYLNSFYQVYRLKPEATGEQQ